MQASLKTRRMRNATPMRRKAAYCKMVWQRYENLITSIFGRNINFMQCIPLQAIDSMAR
jgi:hypothetical protein